MLVPSVLSVIDKDTYPFHMKKTSAKKRYPLYE